MTKKIKRTINVILNQNILNLGKIGETRNVKAGYALNYLIPNKLCNYVTESVLLELEKQKKEELILVNQKRDLTIEIKRKIDKIDQYIIKKRLRDNQYIFGKITKRQVLDVIFNLAGLQPDYSIEINKFPLIKEKGTYELELNLSFDIKTKIELKIIPE